MSLWPSWLQYLSVEGRRSVANVGHCRNGWNKEVISYMYTYIIIMTIKQWWEDRFKMTDYPETMRYHAAAFYIIGLYWERLVQNSCHYLSFQWLLANEKPRQDNSPLVNCRFPEFSLCSGVLHTHTWAYIVDIMLQMLAVHWSHGRIDPHFDRSY